MNRRANDNGVTMGVIGYMLTWTTYGSWLHGNTVGSIWKDKKTATTTLIAANSKLEEAEQCRLKNKTFRMGSRERDIVLQAVLEVCRFRKWDAYAVHVRKNHVHAVISAGVRSERTMNDFKVYATRRLRENAVGHLPEKIWTRHGSMRYLWNERQMAEAIEYVRDQQGQMMAFGRVLAKPRP